MYVSFDLFLSIEACSEKKAIIITMQDEFRVAFPIRERERERDLGSSDPQ